MTQNLLRRGKRFSCIAKVCKGAHGHRLTLTSGDGIANGMQHGFLAWHRRLYSCGGAEGKINQDSVSNESFYSLLQQHAYDRIIGLVDSTDGELERIKTIGSLESQLTRLFQHEENSMAHLKHEGFPHFIAHMKDESPVFMYLHAKLSQRARQNDSYVHYLKKAAHLENTLALFEYATYLHKLHSALQARADQQNTSSLTQRIHSLRHDAFHFLHRYIHIEKNDPTALLLISQYYKNGWAVEKDPHRSLQLKKQASELGNPTASYHYALALLNEKNDLESALSILVQLATEDNSGKQAFLLAELLLDEQSSLAQSALNAHEQGLSYLEQAHKKGFTQATYKLAQLTHSILSHSIHDIDFKKALDYYLEAADKNHPEAQYQVALFYRNGFGSLIPIDPSKSFHYMQRAAYRGHQKAMSWFAQFLHEGFGTSKNINKAHDLIDDLIDQRVPRALFVKYLFLKETELTVKEALEFLNEGVELGDPEAQFQMAVHMLNPDDTQSDPLHTTKEDSLEDPHRAMDLIEFSSDQHYPPAMNEHGRLLLNTNPKRAYQLFEQAAALGFLPALTNMGHVLQHENELRDIPEARRMYQLAIACGGEVNSKYNLACLLLECNSESSHAKAIRLLEEASEQEHAHSLLLLGALYSGREVLVSGISDGWHGVEKDHHIVEKNDSKAYELTRQAYRVAEETPAISNFSEASLNLGLCEYFGIGVAPAPTRGEELIREAADMSLPLAQVYMGWKYLSEGNTLASTYWFDLASEGEVISSQQLKQWKENLNVPPIVFCIPMA